MKFYKENYGADADGNRGTVSISYETEDSDSTEICEKLYDLFLDGTTTGEYNIFIYCYLIDDEIEISVKIEDYIDELIEIAKKDESIKDDEDLQKMINQIIQEKDDLATLKYLQKRV
jgi:hypothetical protein